MRNNFKMYKKVNSDVHLGFGVDENTAFVINGTKGKVIGTHGVYMFDLSKVDLQKHSSRSNFSIDNVRVS